MRDRVEEQLGTTSYAPVAILTLLTGIGLVPGDEAYSFGDVFVSAGFLAIIVAAILGPETGLEPVTCALQERCSGHLSYSGVPWTLSPAVVAPPTARRGRTRRMVNTPT